MINPITKTVNPLVDGCSWIYSIPNWSMDIVLFIHFCYYAYRCDFLIDVNSLNLFLILMIIFLFCILFDQWCSPTFLLVEIILISSHSFNLISLIRMMIDLFSSRLWRFLTILYVYCTQLQFQQIFGHKTMRKTHEHYRKYM